LKIIALCRPSYEQDVALEWKSLASANPGTESARPGTESARPGTEPARPGTANPGTESARPGTESGVCHLDFDAEGAEQAPDLETLCFTRSYFWVSESLVGLEDDDRADPVAEAICRSFQKLGYAETLYSDLWIYHPDTEAKKPLSKFCTSFQRVVENRLKKLGCKHVYSRKNLPVIHVLVVDYKQIFIGLAHIRECGRWMGGIPRVKASGEAPSRSAMKLEEAFMHFLAPEEQAEWLAEGRSAIDLGAAPGGWTHSLLRRGVFVTAVDHGEIDAEILKHDRIIHSRQDAFKYKPKQPVDWLVCDVVENPFRIAELVIDWAKKDQFSRAIVNFKLPMQKKHAAASEVMERLRSGMRKLDQISAKHLYHDRDEFTVYIQRRNRHGS
jgi:23S rRNA (cytidine2498-2'-O)-methyltransferase